jgi:hypothetical protein
VRPECDASAERRRPERSDPAEQFLDEPDSEKEDRRNLDHIHEEQQEDDREDARVRIQDKVGPHDARYGTAGADHRHRGIDIDRDLSQRGRRAADEIENHESGMPEAVLDVVAEYPEVEHVAEQVQPPLVDEHAREERCHVEVGRNDAEEKREQLELRP